MATLVDNKDIGCLKKSRITVFVDEALPDILVVTYEFGVKIFKGVLLDSTKRNLPCGVAHLNPALDTPTTTKNPDDDTLHAVNQRFAYLDPDAAKNKKVQMPSKYKNNKMTVRLRPRQVLCTKCKGICNENSESVSRKRKSTEAVNVPPPPTPSPPVVKRGTNAPVTRSAHSYLSARRTAKKEEPLIDIKTATGLPVLQEQDPLALPDAHYDDNDDDDEDDDDTSSDSSDHSLSRSKRPLRKDTEQSNSVTRTIKISYGPQGEGTVLKIPAQIAEAEENVNSTDGTKAIRKALKRARKEARRKVVVGGSPLYLGNASSPRYTVGSASPRQGLGDTSPRYMMPPFDLTVPRRRKHKMKHKKKHKDEKDRIKHKEGEVSSSTQDETKEQCITQKLSINLKRLNNTYAPCPTSEENASSSDELVPDFPPPNQPLMLRINAQTVSSAIGADGVRLLVGDVVWGKIHGFPWWPGKILTITSCGGQQGPQAHVAWYGSSTSSLMACDQLAHYLDNFKMRHNKKKKGAYKEAVKQATSEARQNAENRVRHPLGNSPSHNIIPPALASPREIDVLS